MSVNNLVLFLVAFVVAYVTPTPSLVVDPCMKIIDMLHVAPKYLEHARFSGDLARRWPGAHPCRYNRAVRIILRTEVSHTAAFHGYKDRPLTKDEKRILDVDSWNF